MIKINVAQQLKENTGSIRRYRIDEFDDNGFHIHGEMEFLRTDRSILAHGILNTIAVGTCSRCLQEFNYPLALNIEEEYFIARDATGGQLLSTSADTGTFHIDENNILDLDEAIRQYKLLAQPMKLICREDCSVLCPQCGQNLNDNVCDCKRSHVDPTWAPLQDLLSKTTQNVNTERG